MEPFWQYLWRRGRTAAWFLLYAVIFCVVFVLYQLPWQAVAYPTALCLGLGVLRLGLRYGRSRRQCEWLQKLAEQKTPCDEELPPARSPEERLYGDIVRRLEQQLRQQEETAAQQYNSMVDYYTVWAHQIKTPIASMRLTLEQEDTATARKLSTELLRIEQYVEMVMTFLRLESPQTDYVFRSCRLDGVVRQAVRRMAGEFIGRHLTLEYTPIAATVVTDEKWLCFVVEQVLSNALKYTKQGGVRIYLEAPATLCIRDTGIGIAPQDLPRVFEKGYTGYNGRAEQRASGLGLYLCRRICLALGHTIAISSRPGEGTLIQIGLEQYALRPE